LIRSLDRGIFMYFNSLKPNPMSKLLYVTLQFFFYWCKLFCPQNILDCITRNCALFYALWRLRLPKICFLTQNYFC